MSGVKLFRLVAWVAVAAVGGLFIGLSVSKPWQQQNAAVASSTGIAAIGGPFQLTSHQGGTIDNAALAGKPYLAFFGFTHCPDVCPTTLYELSDLMNELGPVADQFNVLFFTVDPERDSQELLAQYMTAFDDRVTWYLIRFFLTLCDSAATFWLSSVLARLGHTWPASVS